MSEEPPTLAQATGGTVPAGTNNDNVTSTIPSEDIPDSETTKDGKEKDQGPEVIITETSTDADMDLAPLPTEFDPNAPAPTLPETAAEDPSTSNPFGVTEVPEEDDLNSIEDHGGGEQEQNENGQREEEDEGKMMEYITSLQHFGGPDEEEEEEEVEQIEIRDNEKTPKDEVEEDKDEPADKSQEQQEQQEQMKDSEGDDTVIMTKDVEMTSRQSSPLTPINDIPELPADLNLSPSAPSTSAPLPSEHPLPTSRSRSRTKEIPNRTNLSEEEAENNSNSIPHAESSSSAAARKRSSASITPVPTRLPITATSKNKMSVKRKLPEKPRAKTKGKGKGKAREDDLIVIDGDDEDEEEREDDLNSIEDPDEARDSIVIDRDKEGQDEVNTDEEGRRNKRVKVNGRLIKANGSASGTKKRSGEPKSTPKAPDKATEKIAPRAKGMSDAMIKKLLKGKTKEVQLASCQRPRYGKWGKCTQCIAKLGGDSCRFRDFRTFPIDPETTDIIGPGYFESTEWKEDMTPLPTEFNRDFEEETIVKTEKTVAPMLLPLITAEARHVFGQKSIKRGMDAAKHRSVCDFCSSTIFGGWFFCKTCGRDYCLQCERYFPDSLETIMDSPWPMPDAARPRLLRCQHVGEKQQSRRPAMHYRSKLQAVSRFSEEELKDHWLKLSSFVLDDGKESLDGKLGLMGLKKDDQDVKRILILMGQEEKEVKDSDEPLPLPNDEIDQEIGLSDGDGLEEIKDIFEYTKITNTTAEPIPDPAELRDESRKFVLLKDQDLTNDVFDKIWSKGEPLVVDGVDRKLNLGWGPDDFIERFGDEACYVVNCQTNVPRPTTVGKFFEEFKDSKGRNKDILKLKDWPATDDFKNTHPELYNDFCDALPVPDYTRREGVLNLYSHFPPGPTRPDIGPKMYNAFEAKETTGGFGSTRLHMDVADAVNLLLYASPRSKPKSKPESKTNPRSDDQSVGVVDGKEPSEDQEKNKDEPAPQPVQQDENANPDSEKELAPEPESDGDSQPGCAVWDLFRAEDADLIRDFLTEKFGNTHIFTDPIHSQLFYLDSDLRKELYETRGVRGWRIYQYPGQAVFIPAGCAHQVCNLADCVKIALDFVSPHNVKRCQQLTQDFRKENFAKAWKEDVLQLYNVLWYAWLSCIETRKRRQRESEEAALAQKAREAHLASLRKGRHESWDGGHMTRIGSPLSSAWNVSSVRDEPQLESRSPSLSRCGSPTIARVMGEDDTPRQKEGGAEKEVDKEGEDDGESEKSKKQEEAQEKLAKELFEITIKKEPPSSSETFLGSNTLWSGKKGVVSITKPFTGTGNAMKPLSMKKENKDEGESEDVKPTLSTRQQALSDKQKEQERLKIERRLKNPPRALKTSTLIKLGAKRLDDILEMAQREMFGEGLGSEGIEGMGMGDIWPNPNPNPNPVPTAPAVAEEIQVPDDGRMVLDDTQVPGHPMEVDVDLDMDMNMDMEIRNSLRSLHDVFRDQERAQAEEQRQQTEERQDGNVDVDVDDFFNHEPQQPEEEEEVEQIEYKGEQSVNNMDNMGIEESERDREELAANLRLVGEIDMDMADAGGEQGEFTLE
ncbi:uncharacterized protein L199_008626 [Kwoniella botswanensis]|uniref:uncharacterized protein n=1 Tax=Kwoniella botswanensis TaxID=1268659 RepID=UPI00315DBB5E